MSIRNPKNTSSESSWKVNRLLQLLKKPESSVPSPFGDVPLRGSADGGRHTDLPEAVQQFGDQGTAPGLGSSTFSPETQTIALHEQSLKKASPEASALSVAASSAHRQPRKNREPLEAAYKGQLRPGEILTICLFLQNNSDEPWQGLSIRGETFQGLSYVPGTTFFNEQSLEDSEGTSLLFSSTGYFIPFLDSGEEGVFTLQMGIDPDLHENALLQTLFMLEKDGIIISRAQGSALLQSNPCFSTADCALSCDLEESVLPGQILTYTLSLANSGKGTATRTIVSVKKLLHASYVRGTTCIGSDCVLEPVEGGLLFSQEGLYVGLVPPGEKSIITFKAKVDYPLDRDKIILASGEVCSDQTGVLNIEPLKIKVKSSPKFAAGEDTFMTSSAEGNVKPGDLINCSLFYRNSGNANAYGTVVRVKASPLLEFVPESICMRGEKAQTQEKLLFSTGILLGTIPPGEEGELSFQMRVRTPAENGVTAEIKGFLSFQQAEEVALPPVSHTIESKPFFADSRLTWLEIYPRGQVEPSALLTYTLHFKNEGDAATAYRVRVRSKIPKEIASVPGSLSLNGKRIDGKEESFFSEEGFLIDKIPFGAENRISFQGKVNTLDNGTCLDVTGEIEAEGVEPYSTLPITTVVSAKPDFAQGEENCVEVQPAKEVVPGEILTYTVRFKNKGPVHAKNVIIAGQEPTHTRYVSNKTKLNGIPIPDEEKNSSLLSLKGFNHGPLNVGEQGSMGFQVKVNAPLEKGMLIQGQIKINADNLAIYTLEMPPVVVRSFADFSRSESNFMEVFPDSAVPPGQTLTYVFYYRNSGNDSAKQLGLRASCPPGTSYVKGSTRLNGIPVPDVKGTSPLFGKGLKIEEVKWNGSGNISFQVKADETIDPGAVVENCGILEWEEKIFKTNTVRNTVKSFVDFSNKKKNYIQVSPQGEVTPGSFVTYTLRYKNEGTIPAGNAFVKLYLSPHLQYMPNSTVVSGQPVIDSALISLLLCEEGLSLGNLAPGQDGEISLRCVIARPLDNGTEISATAKLRCNQNQIFELDSARNTVSSTPLFSDRIYNYVEKVLDQKNPSLITFVVNFKNTGNSNAYNVIFKGKLPPTLQHVPNTTCLNGHRMTEEGAAQLLTGQGLLVKKIDEEEEGNFSFQAMTRVTGGQMETSGFPAITVEAQQMQPQEILQRQIYKFPGP